MVPGRKFLPGVWSAHFEWLLHITNLKFLIPVRLCQNIIENNRNEWIVGPLSMGEKGAVDLERRTILNWNLIAAL